MKRLRNSVVNLALAFFLLDNLIIQELSVSYIVVCGSSGKTVHL